MSFLGRFSLSYFKSKQFIFKENAEKGGDCRITVDADVALLLSKVDCSSKRVIS